MKLNYLSFCAILLILSLSFSKLKFKKEHSTKKMKLPEKVKQIEIIKNNKQSSQLIILDNKNNKNELIFTPLPNFFDALIVNYRGKNMRRANSLKPKILPQNNDQSININLVNTATQVNNSNTNSNLIPSNQNNLNLSNSEKNQSLKKKAKPNSFIDMEDHHTLIENDHLNNNEQEDISQLDLNDYGLYDMEELHLNSN